MNIYVSNLSFQVQDEDLREFFADYGEVTSAKVIMDKTTNRSRGFGFVEMPVDEEAKEAIKRMNGGDYNGNRIKVAEAQEKPNTGGGNAGGGFKRNNNNRERSY